jgi:hypothetical protein
MNEGRIKTNAGTLLASAEILLWRFASKIAPVLIPTILFVTLFALEYWTLSLISLLIATFTFYIIAKRSLDLPWDFARTVALFTFSFLIFLSLLLLVSMVTMRLEWSVFALFLIGIGLVLLLFSYYFKE